MAASASRRPSHTANCRRSGGGRSDDRRPRPTGRERHSIQPETKPRRLMADLVPDPSGVGRQAGMRDHDKLRMLAGAVRLAHQLARDADDAVRLAWMDIRRSDDEMAYVERTVSASAVRLCPRTRIQDDEAGRSAPEGHAARMVAGPPRLSPRRISVSQPTVTNLPDYSPAGCISFFASPSVAVLSIHVPRGIPPATPCSMPRSTSFA